MTAEITAVEEQAETRRRRPNDFPDMSGFMQLRGFE